MRELNILPMVSVCVAHFNDGQNLRHLLLSLKENDYPNFEVVVVDDGSTDEMSIQILKQIKSEYLSCWQFILKKKNEGPGPSRNLAVKHAKGQLIVFMDSDDLADRTMISSFVRGMAKSGGA